MTKYLFPLVLIATMASPSFAQDSGLGNSTKDFTRPQAMSVADWSNPSEMQRSWYSAIVRIPSGSGRSKSSNIANLSKDLALIQKKFPAVIYLHGCAGIWSGTHRRIKFLAENGFLVIAPASFARKKYPKSCDSDTHKGAMYRGSIKMRQFDAGYAIEMAKKLAFVDRDNVFLVGLSEGGQIVATFKAKNDRQNVKARIVEGWTCHTGWDEYIGINAPANEPVLTLVAAKDPWFQTEWLKGDCYWYLNRKNGSRSIVYKNEPLAFKHALLDYKTPKREVLKFLTEQLKRK